MARILVVDDDRLVRQTARIVLSDKGHEVVLAEGGRAGIEAAQAGLFDVAIVDLFMPDLDGLHVMETIRRLKPSIRMIAASGFLFHGDCPPMPNFEPMAAEAGAVATLYKPFSPDMLLQAVAKAMQASAAA
ncbi:MAG: response regulator [Stellaceae bacterium]